MTTNTRVCIIINSKIPSLPREPQLDIHYYKLYYILLACLLVHKPTNVYVTYKHSTDGPLSGAHFAPFDK